jgi:arginine utilization protein RocB
MRIQRAVVLRYARAMFFDRVKHYTLALMRQPSVTESDGESAFGAHLVEVLREIPYFVAYPEHLRLHATYGDFRTRHNVFALVRRGGQDTVVLSGHYDVVSTTNFGALEPWAHDPAQLLPRMIGALETETRDASTQQALDDLRSGDFMPGRGALDMKSGDAIGIALLERFATDPDATGNLLLLCNPDEENYSHGMRSAMRDLPALLNEWGLRPLLAVNLDSSGLVPEGAQEVFMGSVGKYMPFVHVTGRPTHAGDPFGGVSAPLVAAELQREVEGNLAYSDASPSQGELPPMPVALRMRDLKQHYDVTTPQEAFVAFNVLSFASAPPEVLSRIAAAADHAMRAAIATMRQRALEVAQPFGIAGATVLLFADALQQARAQDASIDAQLDSIAGDRTLDVLTATEHAATLVARGTGVSGPLAIVGFAPFYYPVSAVASADRFAFLSHVKNAAQRAGATVLLRPFFTGISDMSFLGAMLSADTLSALADNAPGWRVRWNLSAESAAGLGVPTVNIGPSGRDYHQRCERVHMPLSFETAPRLIWELLRSVLAA